MLRDFGLVTLVDLSVSLLGVLIALPAALVIAERGRRSAPRGRRRRPGRPGAGVSRARAGAPERRLRTSQGRAAGPPLRALRGSARLIVLVLITLNTLLTKPNGAAARARASLPPFAVPLATAPEGDANVATATDEGAPAGPACTVRKPAC